MINITDDRARRLWQQEMNRQMEVLEKPYIRKLTPLLKRQFREASKYVSQGMLRDIDFAVDKTRKENLDLLKIHYRKVFTVFGNKAYGILEKTKFISVPEMKSPMDEYWSEINRWIETEAATKIRGIQDATKRTIASIIQSGMREQLSHRDIAKKIENTSSSINPYRARTISLTETHTGAVKAVDSAVKSTRIEMEKEWVSSKDMRTRTRDKGSAFEHYKTFPAGADRERVPMDSKFVGTGQPMTLPGVGGSAGNVVRCRCVVLYFTVNQVVQETKPYEPEERVNGRVLDIVDIGQRDYVADRLAPNDFMMKTIANKQGFDGLPTVKSSQEIDDLINKKGYRQVFRGVSKEAFAKEFQGGEYFSGKGMFGTGIYSDVDIIRAENFAGRDGVIMRIAIDKKAKVAKFYDLVEEMKKDNKYAKQLSDLLKKAMKEDDEVLLDHYRIMKETANDVGKYAAMRGIDVIDGGKEFVILNRTKVAVQKEFVKSVIDIEKPMTVIGDLSKCILSDKSFAWYETKERPLGCNDYVREGKKWLYRGKEIEEEKELARLHKLGIPPAWSNVTASKDVTAKIQAIGQDKAGRWQYRYSAEHAGKAAIEKFDRVKSFTRDMAAIREGIEKGMKNGDPRAFLMEIENRTVIRVGSDVDFKAKKKAYGLTTLQNEHVTISGSKISFDFTAKEGIKAHYELEDKVLANWLKERKAKTVAGEKLFPDVPARKLNDYLSWLSGGKDYTVKDFRTYHATRIAHDELKIYAGKELSKKEKTDIIKRVSEKVSGFLRNTPEMARNSYIDPMVWDFIGGL